MNTPIKSHCLRPISQPVSLFLSLSLSLSPLSLSLSLSFWAYQINIQFISLTQFLAPHLAQDMTYPAQADKCWYKHLTTHVSMRKPQRYEGLQAGLILDILQVFLFHHVPSKNDDSWSIPYMVNWLGTKQMLK